MFMIVKYGECKEQFFNTDCRTKVLLECIKEKCDAMNEELIDLADENGDVMFLNERRNSYGKEFLKPRGVYVLVKREKCSQNYPIYTPLLQDSIIVNEGFLRQLSLLREEAIKKDEDQRLLENDGATNGKNKNSSGRRTYSTRDSSNRRTQSFLYGKNKKPNNTRPSR
ncbi:uncharacterized protein CXorf65 homolog [Rhopilema esculentum]|uniref:uncharacterized protein CXorf65 homolog n=1 Tax=Rhopilema esculentum TaxID=499914 RepID=UPI0031E21A97